jgi:uncharacterized protein (UPF0332 family)
MNAEIEALLRKSRRSLESAKRQISDSDYDFAVSRVYYAMFYAAQAVLLTKNAMTSKHSGVIALFYEHFVKTGTFDKKHHQAFNDAFDLRQQGDYVWDQVISKETADSFWEKANDFVTYLENYLREAFHG